MSDSQKRSVLKFTNTIHFKISLIMAFILLLLLAVSAIYGVHEKNSIRQQVYHSDTIMLSTLSDTIDNSFLGVDATLLSLGQDYLSLLTSLAKDDAHETGQFMMTEEIKAGLSKVLTAVRNANGVFLYHPNGNRFVFKTDSNDSYDQEQLITKMLGDLIADKPPELLHNWKMFSSAGRYYLLRVLHFSEYYAGVWIDANKYLSSLDPGSIIGEHTIFLTSLDGVPYTADSAVLDADADLSGEFGDYYMAGQKDRYMVIRNRLKSGDFYLTALILDSSILENLTEFQLFVALIISLALLVLMIVFAALQKMFLSPIDQIVRGMKSLQHGDFDTKLNLINSSEEFLIVQDTFNAMSAEIKNLKVGILEQQIDKQRAQMQFFKMQAKPHFFINSLNSIFIFAQLMDYEKIQEMTYCLAMHYRYILGDSDAVTVEKEIEHIQNYLRIQEIRFSKKLKVDIDIAEEVSDLLIPQFTIHTFVENAVKNTVTLSSDIEITVRCFLKEASPAPRLYISVTDTGNGFSDVVLEKICAGEQIEDENGKRVGIFNIQKRLELMHGGRAKLKFSNRLPHGALVEIELPMNDIKEE